MTIKLPNKVYREKEKRNKAKKSQTKLPLPSIPKLSEDIMQDLFDYKSGKQCGLYIDYKYIQSSKIELNDTDKLEAYFEYKALNKEVEGIYTKSGKLSLPYQRMEKQSENFKNFSARNRWKVEQSFFEFTNPKFTATSDIIALDENIKSKVVFKKRFIIDLRTSANLEYECDKVSDKDYLKAIHHKMLANYEWGIEDIPYYFMVFSTKNDWEFKVIKINVEASTYKQHYKSLLHAKAYLDEQYILGFKKQANMHKCNNCAIKNKCLDAIDTPLIEELYI